MEEKEPEKKELLLNDILTRSPSCGLIIIDNFYNNAIDTRNYILTQEFSVRGNYPGQRAPKVGGALRKIPEVSGSHGFAGYSPHVPTPFVPPNYAPAHLKINKAPRS
jgi:hypothetical protein